MDSKVTKRAKEKQEVYLKKFEAWKQQKQRLEKQSKTSGLPPWNKHSAKEGASRMNNNKLTVGQRRETFEIPAALRNSPIPLSLLPKVPRCGPPRKSVEKDPTKFRSGKENNTNTQLKVNKPKYAGTKPNEALVKHNNRKSLSNVGVSAKPKGAPDLDKRKSCVIHRPSASTMAQSSSSSHQPFIRHTKTSLARMNVLPEVKDDYIERFNRWKAEKTQGNNGKNLPPKSGISCLEKRKSYIPQTIKQRSQNETKKGAHCKVPVPVKSTTAEISGQLRRKTISELTTRSTKPDPSKTRCDRRQTVSSATLNRPAQPHKSGLTSTKRKNLVPEHSVSKRKRVSYSQVTPQKPRQTPRRKTQASLRQELEEWLKAKGKTPSRCRHLMCYGTDRTSAGGPCQPHTKPLLSVEEISQQQRAMEQELTEDNVDMDVEKSDNLMVGVNIMEEKLRQLLKECMALLDMSCPVESLLAWLDRIAVDMPEALKSADFWISKAKLMQSTGNTNHVLEVFEQAVRHEAKPSDALAKELTEMVKEMTTGGLKYLGVSKCEDLLATPRTPGRQIKEVQRNNIFESSAIKFCVKDKTPLLKRMRDVYGTDGCSPCMIVTPVRRSTRKSLATIHESLQEKDRLYASMTDIPLSEQKVSLYQVNPALTAESHTHLTEGVS
ncbi:cytoskeleton-associated protein 2-like [Liolophura sinensis]|uniref:cytoskeleton-associated protein 2-like n=1 Tax=Liolophura sinensis TaxID=3198878 RepID=UPI003158011C